MIRQYNPQNPNYPNAPPLHPPGTAISHPNTAAHAIPQSQHPLGISVYQLHPNSAPGLVVVHQAQPVMQQNPVHGPSELPVVHHSSSHAYNRNWANQPIVNQFIGGKLEQTELFQQNTSEQPVAGSGDVQSEHFPVLYASSGHVYSHNWANQPVVNQSTNVKVEQPKLVTTFWCEICNIDCNSQDAYNKHMCGKKHMKKLQTRSGPAAVLPNSISSVGHLTSSGQMGTFGGQLVHRSSVVDAGGEFDTTSQVLNGGATSDSVQVGGVGSLFAALGSNSGDNLSTQPHLVQSVFCEVCKISCDTEEVYSKHLAGKKHQKNLGKLGISSDNNAEKPIAWCKICEIACTSQEDYTKHLRGKKHQKNLGKVRTASKHRTRFSEVVGPSSVTTPIIGPMETPNARRDKSIILQASKKRPAQHATTPADLETKRRKVVECGAAASSVRTCTICNVVCNSDTVYVYHLAGQKHAAMLKREAAATTGS